MLKLLLDEHISPDVAEGLAPPQSRYGSPLHGGVGRRRFSGPTDSACLQDAARRGLTLVTYDRRTIPLLLKTWAEEERTHAGVVFVDEKTISPADIGGLVRALKQLSKETWRWDWTNRIHFLRR